ncbi:hypothetical protein VPH35_011184 [Triticum aestivum]
MAPGKRRRNNVCVPAQEPAPEIASAFTLPADLLLEIVARTDVFTIVRCAALCKHLRRDILSLSFIHRVALEAAPCILAYLSTYVERRLTVVHPVTPATMSFCHDRLSPFMARCMGSLLDKYRPVTFRDGLIVLCNIHVNRRAKHKHRLDLCVHNPITGHTSFLPKSPYARISITSAHKYVLLTAADGIDCSFMLLFFDLNLLRSIKLNTATSSSGTWGTLTTYDSHPDSPWWSIRDYNHPAILHGGVLHWLADHGKQILSYDVRTRMSGLVKLPPTNCKENQLHLATSSHGNALKLITLDGFKISTWLHHPPVLAGGGGVGGWVLDSVIDVEEKLRPLYPDLPVEAGPDVLVELNGSGKRNGDVVVLQVRNRACVVLDLETKDMHRQKWGSCSPLLEIDLPSHLQTMKIFS